jgi:cytochrome P450
MLRAQQGGASAALMTDRQLRDELQTMIVAGSDTTATTLAFALAELARHPEVADAAAAEVAGVLAGADPAALPADAFQQGRMPLIAAIANETLRLYPAATETGRVCAQDEAFGEYAVPQGTAVLPSIWSMHRHEAFWPRPTEWLPERWLPANAAMLAPHATAAFSPFTAGPRACIGRYFALLELQVMLAVVLSRARLEPAPAGGSGPGSDRGSGANFATRANFTLASAGGLPVIASPRC